MQFIVFEGIDGSGKSTQARELVSYVRHNSEKDVYFYQEPGSTDLGRKIREIVKGERGLDPVTQLLLFNAARRQFVVDVLKPLINRPNTLVILDRYYYSTIAYQCYGQDITIREAQPVIDITGATAIIPDMVVWIDTSVNEAMKRHSIDTTQDTYDSDKELQRRVSLGYLTMWERHTQHNWARIPGNGSVEDVKGYVLTALAGIL